MRQPIIHMDYPIRDIKDNFCRKEFLPWLYHVLIYNLTHIGKKHFPLDSIINYRDWFYWFRWDGNKFTVWAPMGWRLGIKN